MLFKLIYTFVIFALIHQFRADDVVYRMCIPHKFHQDCLNLLKKPSEAGIHMECVTARDRMECLDLINEKKADVLAADPEDMYVAYHMKNQDFRVISEFRTKVEKNAEFRYEGIILVKKSTKAANLKELQGLKSCHTGFGRNVGYKIPITKLKNLNILKVSQDPSISATERELKALSAFFSKSCLVGTYSQNAEYNLLLKKKYSNLCALCEKPEQCNYPDKFSGYDGAIRCLDKGEGEVAFTKTSFVKKYFGLIDGVTAEGNPDNFEYLCEDGSRKPITGPLCSWAQRPWKGYISNNDAVNEKPLLDNLQKRLNIFYENGLEAENKKSAANLLIESESVLHQKTENVKPKEYLERAGYRDVIERDGSLTNKIKLCVETKVEAKKCEKMTHAAYSRDIRPEFDCILESDCIESVKKGNSDAVILSSGSDQISAKNANLKPIVYETYDENDVMVVVADPELQADAIKKRPIKFNSNDVRAEYAARLMNLKRGVSHCELPKVESDSIEIVYAKDLNNFKNKMLVCLDGSKKPVTEYLTCNVEAHLPSAVFVKSDISSVDQDSFIHSFSLISDKFGHNGKIEDVFELFDEFEPGSKDVLFHDHADKLSTELKLTNGVDMNLFKQLQCEN